MIALLQRILEAKVVVDGATVGAIGAGLMVLLCAERNDTEKKADAMRGHILGEARIVGAYTLNPQLVQ